MIEEVAATEEDLVMLGLDNINWQFKSAYGSVAHTSIFNMDSDIPSARSLNYTMRGAVCPNLTGIADQFKDPHLCKMPQSPMNKVKYPDLLVENNPKLKETMELYSKQYILDAMDTTFNQIPLGLQDIHSDNDFKKLSERNKIKLKEHQNDVKAVKINTLKENDISSKSETVTLPISFEHSATTTGMSKILDNVAEEFNIPLNKHANFLPFDEDKSCF